MDPEKATAHYAELKPIILTAEYVFIPRAIKPLAKAQF